MKILRKPEVIERIGVSGQTLWRLRRLPESDPRRFPTPVQLGPNSVGWIEAEVEAWLEARAAERSLGGATPIAAAVG